MELIYILAGIAAAFAFVWWLIVWTDRRDMRAAIRETNAQFLMEGKPIPEWARPFGPHIRQPKEPAAGAEGQTR